MVSAWWDGMGLQDATHLFVPLVAPSWTAPKPKKIILLAGVSPPGPDRSRGVATQRVPHKGPCKVTERSARNGM